MTYGSVCSGIEAASVAWDALGWTPAWFAEIDPFPSAVLAHHYPTVPNHGDFTAIQAAPGSIDVLVGGTPCQSFSVAGLRRGLADDRGNLALEFLRLAGRARPPWLVWENVAGVLSSSGGRDFGAFLGGLVELGYGFAYRVLDAQHFGVPQRRRRVFVVGHLGDWRRAAAVLFERDSLSGNPPPGRETRKDASVGTLGGTSPGGGWRFGADEAAAGHLIPAHGETAFCLPASSRGTGDGHGQGWNSNYLIEPSLVPFDTTQVTSASNYSNPQPGDPCHPLAAGAHPPAIAYQCHGNNVGPMGTVRSGNGGTTGGVPFIAGTLTREYGSQSGNGMGEMTNGLIPASAATMAGGSAVRRLTPRECERLQGFPDDWTLVPYRGKPASDGPRYKAIGNSMAVPVMRWIGRRLAEVHAL